jgi:hypothetical protein
MMMRSAGNFSPEWGYLAPAPSMLRTLRVVLVATAVGATAGAGVVLSLVDRSTGNADKVAVAAHAIVTSAQAATAQESPAVNAVAAPLPAAALTIGQSRSENKPNVAIAAPAASAAPQVQTPQVQTPQGQASQVRTAPAMPQPDQAAQSAAGSAAQQTSTASVANAAPANDPGAASMSQQPAVAALSDGPDAPAATSDANGGDQAIVGPQQPAQQKKPKHHTASTNNRDFIGNALRHLFSARAGPFYPNRGL